MSLLSPAHDFTIIIIVQHCHADVNNAHSSESWPLMEYREQVSHLFVSHESAKLSRLNYEECVFVDSYLWRRSHHQAAAIVSFAIHSDNFSGN